MGPQMSVVIELQGSRCPWSLT